MLVNSAITIYQGSSPISKVYQGDTVVWQSQPSVHYVSWIYTTQNDGNTSCINTGIVPSTADTIDVIWRVHYQDGYHIATYNPDRNSLWYNWRAFNINNTLYYDYNESGSRAYKYFFKPSSADTLNWEIGNFYIKDKTTGTNLVSKPQKGTIGDGLNYTYALGLGQAIFKEFKITRNGDVLFYGKAALDSNSIPCIYDEISQTYKYYNGTQEYLTYDE